MRAAYGSIYLELKGLIVDGTYAYKSFLPSEAVLIKRYGCAHNTVRKALGALAAEGYVLPIHGKGVRVIYQPPTLPDSIISSFDSHDIESFEEASTRYGFAPRTQVLSMEQVSVNAELADYTHFEMGQQLVRLERVRFYNDKPLSREINYFRSDVVDGMTKADAETSVYRFIERERHGKLVTSKRRVTVEQVNDKDEELLCMNGADFVAVVRLITFDGDGLLCEFSELRHHPSTFMIEQTALRSRIDG